MRKNRTNDTPKNDTKKERNRRKKSILMRKKRKKRNVVVITKVIQKKACFLLVFRDEKRIEICKRHADNNRETFINKIGQERKKE